jgi:hypothetical protein
MMQTKRNRVGRWFRNPSLSPNDGGEQAVDAGL